MSKTEEEFIAQLKAYFHKLTVDYLITTFGESKGGELFSKYTDSFETYYDKNLQLMLTNMAKRHGINSIFVLALDKALEDENISHEELKDHVIAIYSVMMDELISSQVKALEESTNPWQDYVEGAKKGNAELYENEFFEARVTFDIEPVFGIDIRRCLYFEIFQKNMRQDLGPILCEFDQLLASGVTNWIRFERKKTIAEGWSHCDFRYFPIEYTKKNVLYENQEKIEKIVIDFVHKETGWGTPLKPQCEFEDFYLRGIKQLEEGNIVVLVEYHFDEDGFSMYPRNHILEGELELDKNGNILDFKLEETFTGPACVEDPYKK